MSGISNSPRLLGGGLVLLDPDSAAVERIITFQYNPATLSRSLQIQDVAGASEDRSEALRVKGPPVETISLEAELDATDALAVPNQNRDAVEFGLHPQLAALESIVYPTSENLLSNNNLASGGMLEIVPMEQPLTLFVWSKSRVLPVRVTELSITEDAFDADLNPIRAKVSLGLRVLSVDDLEFSHKGASLFMSYLQQKESLARRAAGGDLDALGIGEIP